jgi:hypothetical protein
MRVQSGAARVRKVRVLAPLDDRHVDARERELGGEHQARGAAAGDDYVVMGRGHLRRCSHRFHVAAHASEHRPATFTPAMASIGMMTAERSLAP